MAINLYHRGGLLLCARTIMRDVMARSGATFDDIESARAWLSAQPGCNGRVGVIGFCMGGGFALMLVSGHGFSAISVNYGGNFQETFTTPDCSGFEFAQVAVTLAMAYRKQKLSIW